MSKKSKQNKPILRNGRPTFNYNDDTELEIRAGGLIYYRIVEDPDTNISEPKFLMIKARGKYEDFGGCTDKVDSCIEETVAREAFEESNEIFEQEQVLEQVKKTVGTYNSRSKYVVFLVETSVDYNVKDFGDREYHDNIERTVEWIPYSKLKDKDFTKEKLHFRLMFYKFFADVDKIYKNSKNTD
jgi:ADP-ribose pyrophosphatase YjhB (NUDIX family)